MFSNVDKNTRYFLQRKIKLRKNIVKRQFAKISIWEKSEHEQLTKINPCKITKKSPFAKIKPCKKNKKNGTFFKRYFYCIEDIDAWWENLELQIAGSESFSEATRNKNENGNERGSGNEEELIDSCDVFEIFDDERDI